MSPSNSAGVTLLKKLQGLMFVFDEPLWLLLIISMHIMSLSMLKLIMSPMVVTILHLHPLEMVFLHGDHLITTGNETVYQ